MLNIYWPVWALSPLLSIVHHELVTVVTEDRELTGVQTYGVALVLLLQTEDIHCYQTTFAGSILKTFVLYTTYVNLSLNRCVALLQV